MLILYGNRPSIPIDVSLPLTIYRLWAIILFSINEFVHFDLNRLQISQHLVSFLCSSHHCLFWISNESVVRSPYNNLQSFHENSLAANHTASSFGAATRGRLTALFAAALIELAATPVAEIRVARWARSLVNKAICITAFEEGILETARYVLSFCYVEFRKLDHRLESADAHQERKRRKSECGFHSDKIIVLLSNLSRNRESIGFVCCKAEIEFLRVGLKVAACPSSFCEGVEPYKLLLLSLLHS